MQGLNACLAYGSLPGNLCTAADAVKACVQATLKFKYKTWIELPPELGPAWWKDKFVQPVVLLVKALCGHPDAGHQFCPRPEVVEAFQARPLKRARPSRPPLPPPPGPPPWWALGNHQPRHDGAVVRIPHCQLRVRHQVTACHVAMQVAAWHQGLPMSPVAAWHQGSMAPCQPQPQMPPPAPLGPAGRPVDDRWQLVGRIPLSRTTGANSACGNNISSRSSRRWVEKRLPSLQVISGSQPQDSCYLPM